MIEGKDEPWAPGASEGRDRGRAMGLLVSLFWWLKGVKGIFLKYISFFGGLKDIFSNVITLIVFTLFFCLML